MLIGDPLERLPLSYGRPVVLAMPVLGVLAQRSAFSSRVVSRNARFITLPGKSEMELLIPSSYPNVFTPAMEGNPARSLEGWAIYETNTH